MCNWSCYCCNLCGDLVTTSNYMPAICAYSCHSTVKTRMDALERLDAVQGPLVMHGAVVIGKSWHSL